MQWQATESVVIWLMFLKVSDSFSENELAGEGKRKGIETSSGGSLWSKVEMKMDVVMVKASVQILGVWGVSPP